MSRNQRRNRESVGAHTGQAEPPRQPAPSPTWMAKLAAAMGLSAVWFAANIKSVDGPLDGWDEGSQLYIASQVLKGKVLYRDLFTLYPPGTHWVDALSLVVFGHTVVARRIAMHLIGALKPAATFLFGLTFLGPVYAFAAACASLMWGDGRLHVTLGLLALMCVHAWERRAGRGWLGLSGLLAGLATLHKHEFGIPIALGCAILLLLRNRRRESPAALRSLLLPLAGGFALPIVPVIALFAAQGALPDMLQQLGPQAMALIRASSLPYPPLLPLPGLSFWTRGDLTLATRYAALLDMAMRSYVYYIMPAFLVTMVPLLVWRHRTGRWARTDDYAAVVWLLGVMSFPSATQRTDLGHLHAGTSFIPLLAAWQAQTVVEAVRGSAAGLHRRALSGVILAGVLLVMVGIPGERMTTAMRSLQAPLPPPLLIGRAGIRSPVAAQSGLVPTVLYVARNTAPHEPVFTYQCASIINFLTDRPRPGRYSMILDAYLDDREQLKLIRALQRERVRYVVHWLPYMDNKPFGRIAPRLDRYLNEHYEPVETYGPCEIRRLRTAPAFPGPAR